MADAIAQADRCLEAVAEEDLERLRRGEHPPISEYTRRHPELAGRRSSSPSAGGPQ